MQMDIYFPFTFITLLPLLLCLIYLESPTFAGVIEKEGYKGGFVNVVVSNIGAKTKRGSKSGDEKIITTDNIDQKGVLIKFIMILSDRELSKINNIFLGLDSSHRFQCSYFVVKYIMKNKINSYDFIKRNCRYMGIFKTNDRNFRSLKPTESDLQDNSTMSKDSFGNYLVDEELFNDINDSKSCCCVSRTSSCGAGSKSTTHSSTTTSFGDEINFLNEIECEDDYYDFSDEKGEIYEDINYDISCLEKDEILKELFEAVNRDSSENIEYSGLNDMPVSNMEIKNALSKTEKNIEAKKKSIRTVNESYTTELRMLSTFDTPEIILDNLSVKNAIDFARKLTGAITKSKEIKVRNHFTAEDRRQIFTAIIEFFYIYSTIEADYEEITRNYEKKAELRSFFSINSNICLINSVFGKLIGRYEESISKKVYSVQDCTRFFMNIITPTTKQILPTEKLVNKLKYTCEFTFPLIYDENIEGEFFEEYIEEEEGKYIYDSILIEHLIGKNFKLDNIYMVNEKSVKAIIANRKEIPIDRPSECYKKLVEIFLWDKLYNPSPENELKLRRICAKVYGLLGFLAISNELQI
ncbi:hypothetical protein FG379_002048 [Cryptosporidium bovis]|uniref:uncharacterized protein n=1 Tax=Cryptosporidium bovis TaxID=310047 RepID=UPI00351A4F77|nr:hypothetical protein FG379_002048 [Cryptosporidium bovis]